MTLCPLKITRPASLEFLAAGVAGIGGKTAFEALHGGIPWQHRCKYASGQHPGDGGLGASEISTLLISKLCR